MTGVWKREQTSSEGGRGRNRAPQQQMSEEHFKKDDRSLQPRHTFSWEETELWLNTDYFTHVWLPAHRNVGAINLAAFLAHWFPGLWIQSHQDTNKHIFVLSCLGQRLHHYMQILNLKSPCCQRWQSLEDVRQGQSQVSLLLNMLHYYCSSIPLRPKRGRYKV